ncbi:NAD+ diphosphatase [Nakamurella sp. UYEF19]|uniref:NAD(+) diphosphatase n=1 Tax=Nakamurella sp. UYEF19 TaxID=1756392 RepID=UPI00339A0F77
MSLEQKSGTMLSSGFPIEMPVLSRAAADRSEDLRDPVRTAAAWPTARVLTVDEAGRVPIDSTDTGVSLSHHPATDLGAAPPPEAVLLGTVAPVGSEGPIDYWAIPGEVAVGGELWSFGTSPDPSTLREVGGLLSDTDAGLMTAAVAVLNWHRNGRFCPRCGEPSAPRSAGWSRLCPNGHEEFPRTDPAVIVLVHDGADKMVLARQPSWPSGRVSVLAGFTEAGEALEGTVTREIAEEVGLHVTDIGYLGSQPWPFPRSLMVGFAARAEPGSLLFPRDGEIEAAQWVDRAAVRRMLANGGESDGLILPPGISIARRMVEGWAALD